MSKPLVNVEISTLPFDDRVKLVHEEIQRRMEYLLQAIHDGGEFDARTGSLVSIAERLTNALNEEMVALIVAYRQQREGASHE